MKRPARLHQRHVEALAVVGDDQACGVEDSRQRFEHRALAARTIQEELPDPKSPVLEPAAADEKRERAGATTEAGGLDVEEDDAVSPAIDGSGTAIEQTQRRGRFHAIARQAPPPVKVVVVPHAIDRDTRAALAADDLALEPLGRFFRIAGDRKLWHVRSATGGIPVSWRTMRRRREVRSLHGDQAAAAGAVSISNRRSATSLASGPVAPSGPTQDGHPDTQGHPSISARVRVRS